MVPLVLPLLAVAPCRGTNVRTLARAAVDVMGRSAQRVLCAGEAAGGSARQLATSYC
jgi:hypothetical protein